MYIDKVVEPFLVLDENTGNTIAMIASSKSGKTTLLKFLMNKYFNKYITVLFSPNMNIPLYKDFKIKDEIVNNDIVQSMKYINSKTDNKYDFLCVFDDVINTRNNSLIDRLVCTYRNANISSIISVQYCSMISKGNRSSINTTILGKINNTQVVEDVVKMYLFGRFTYQDNTKMKMIDCINYYKALTKDHHFLMLTPDDECYRIKLSLES